MYASVEMLLKFCVEKFSFKFTAQKNPLNMRPGTSQPNLQHGKFALAFALLYRAGGCR